MTGTSGAQGSDISRAAERTGLAWNRTLLAAAALSGFMAVSASRSSAPISVLIALGAAAVLLVVATSVVSHRVGARAASALMGTARAARPLPTLAMAGLASSLSIIALVVSAFSDGGQG